MRAMKKNKVKQGNKKWQRTDCHLRCLRLEMIVQGGDT